MRPGATSIASNRMSQSASSGCTASQASGGRDDALAAGAAITRLGRVVERARAPSPRRTPAAAAARDDVDLADRASEAPRHDAIALGDEKAAARLSADRPMLNAPRRAPGAAGRRCSSGARHLRSSRHRRAFAERERALIDLAARPAGGRRDFADGVLDRGALQAPAAAARRPRRRRAAGAGSRRRDDDDEFAADLGAGCISARQGRRSPRRTSSCSLVSSRQTAACALAEFLGQRRPACGRCADRFRTGSASRGYSCSSAMRVRRWPSFGGRKPSKKNRSVGKPATASAASAADGAGRRADRKPGLAGRAHQLEARDRKSAACRHRKPARPIRRRQAGRAASAGPPRRCARDRA